MTRTSAAFADLGYTPSDTPRRPRGAAAAPTPVCHPRAPGDRSAGAAALRELRRALDHKQGMLTDGSRPGDDPFARRQLEDAYERLKTALAVYNTFAADLGVPGAEASIGGVPVTVPVPSQGGTPAKAENRPAKPLAPRSEGPRHADDLEPAQRAAIEQARAEFLARGRS
jgi:hypothetical protein